MRVLVCGGRDYGNPADLNDPRRRHVFEALDRLTTDEGDMLPRAGTVLIHGGCPTGADRCADEWAVVNWVPIEAFPADWAKHGRAAGPIRNARMLSEGKPDLVVAFPGGRGTANMVALAEAQGVKVERP